MLFILMLGSFCGEWKIGNTGVFDSLSPYYVIVTNDQHVFILDTSETKVLKYGPNSVFNRSFGKKGQGPSEFLRPLKILCDEDFVYIAESNLIHTFDMNGNFKERMKLKHNLGARIVKGKNAWASIKRIRNGSTFTEQVLYSKDLFKTSSVLFEWVREEKVKKVGGMTHVEFNPIPISCSISLANGSEYLFLNIPGKFEIKVFDMNTGEHIRSIKRKVKKIPFNEEFGKETFDRLKKRNRNKGVVKYIYSPPEYAPPINKLFPSPDGGLAVICNSSSKNEPFYVRFFDHFGKETGPAWDIGVFQRVLWMDEEFSLITVHNEGTEELELVKVPRKQTMKFVKMNPIGAQ